jgi:thiol-disulfide isomerase/thioredoxin
MKHMKKLLMFAGVGALTLAIAGFTPDNSPVKAKRAITTERALAVGTNIGDVAPEIEMTDVNGKAVKLSSLRGKMVLIDFWASWCGPCRRENPNVVEAYDKYSKAKFKTAKGFDIFSVSLDQTAEAWKAAITKDNLKWKSHVSDLKGWNNAAAAIYGVRSIPMSFLIDEKGVIVGKNLRGLELHKKFDEYVKSL